MGDTRGRQVRYFVVTHGNPPRVPASLEEARRLLEEPESVAAERSLVRYAVEITTPRRGEVPHLRRVLALCARVEATRKAWPEARLGDRDRELIDFLVEQAVREWTTKG